MSLNAFLIESDEDLKGHGRGSDRLLAEPNLKKVVPPPDAGFIVLHGKDLPASPDKEFPEDEPDRLHALPRSPGDHDIDFANHKNLRCFCWLL